MHVIRLPLLLFNQVMKFSVSALKTGTILFTLHY